MGFWQTILIEGQPKYSEFPGARWQLNPAGGDAVIELIGSIADYAVFNADPDMQELTRTAAETLSALWGNPSWQSAESIPAAGYCTIDDIRDRGIDETKADNAQIQTAIGMAVTAIDAYCRRDFWLREKSYWLDGDNSTDLFVDDIPIVSVIKLALDGIPETEFRIYRELGLIRLLDTLYPEGVQNIEVCGRFGFEKIPAEVKESCILLAVKALRALKGDEYDPTKTISGSTQNAIGLKRAKIEDISVEFEYPKSDNSGTGASCGDEQADALLLKYRRKCSVAVV